MLIQFVKMKHYLLMVKVNHTFYGTYRPKGVNDVLVKEMRARFVADPAEYSAIILPDTGHWMVEENPEGVEKSLSNFLFK